MLLRNIHKKRERKKRTPEEDNRTFSTKKALKRYEQSEEDQKQKKHEIRQQNIQLYMLVEYLIYLWIFINGYMCNIWGRLHKMFCWNASICAYNKRSFCLIYFIKIVINAPNL